jgi:hypothetical protein
MDDAAEMMGDSACKLRSGGRMGTWDRWVCCSVEEEERWEAASCICSEAAEEEGGEAEFVAGRP